MKPAVVDMWWARRRRERRWVVWAATLCLLCSVAGPEIVHAEETRPAKATQAGVKHESTEPDWRPPHATIREGLRTPTPTPLSRWRDASPRERRAIREKARERWEGASPRERRLFRRGMVGLRRVLPELTEIERLMLLRNLFALPKADRKSMRARLRAIDRLSPDVRKEFIRELRDMTVGPSQESIRIERNVDRWRELSESERDDYREQMRRFRSLSAEERRRLLDEWEHSPETQP